MVMAVTLPSPRVGFAAAFLPFDAAPRLCPSGLGMAQGRAEVSSSWSRERVAKSRARPRVVCQASGKDKIEGARKKQMQATELFAELLKANDVKAVAKEHVESLSEDFFVIASTYLDLAKKEGNVEVVTRLETTLQTALSVKEATLRPEIRLLNQLLRQNDQKERSDTINSNRQYLAPDSYFFQLLGMMSADVDKQTNNPRRSQLLAQLRTISKETKEVTKAAKKSKGFGAR